MGISQVYDDGQCFAASVLDIAEDDIIKAFLDVVQTIACISLAANYPTLPSVAHSIINSYKNLVAVALTTEEYSWESIDELKDRIANPEAYASAAPAATTTAATEEAKEEAKKEESDSESEEDGTLLNPSSVFSYVC
jgi:large subunit ribosomal protein LP0